MSDLLKQTLTSIEPYCNIDDIDAERELYRRLADILRQRGLAKRTGLFKAMSRLLNESEPTVSRKAGRYLDPDDRSTV